MRRSNSKAITSYSHTDDEVRFLVRVSLLTGCLVGGIIVGALMRAFA